MKEKDCIVKISKKLLKNKSISAFFEGMEEEEREVFIHLASLVHQRNEKMTSPFWKKRIASVKENKRRREKTPIPIISTARDFFVQMEDRLQTNLNRMFADEKED